MRLKLHPSKYLRVLFIALSAFASATSGPLFSQCAQPPALPSATPAAIQCGQPAILTASGSSGEYRWYNVPTGGTALFTGAVFTTPSLFSTSQIYYVEAYDPLEPTCSSGRVAVTVTTTSSIVAPTAAGASIFCGTTASLTAVGSGGEIRWYTSASGGNAVGTAASFTTPTLTSTRTYYVEELESNDIFSASFTNAGNFTWTVPAGVTQITVDVIGGEGGNQVNGGIPGTGGRVQALVNVTPGEVLNLNVGGRGSNGTSSWSFFSGGFNGGGSGYRGGGGGGASDIRRNGNALANRIVVAGGGGGGGWNCGGNQDRGGNGGGLTAESGWRCNQTNDITCNSAGPGTQSAGGTNCIGAGNGTSGTGGNASSSASSSGHGGGGGGWFGGSGGGSGGGGGGGSSYTAPGILNVIHTQGGNSGIGRIDIHWTIPVCRSPRIPVVVNVNTLPAPAVNISTTLCGSSPVLTASGSPSNLYEWYSDVNLTQLISTSSSITLPPLVSNDTIYVKSFTEFDQTFNFTGNVQSITIPDGVTSVEVDVIGAQGGQLNTSNLGGRGGRVRATLSVNPGDVLNLYVGQQATSNIGGWNGGGLSGTNLSNARGGGGASDIRLNGTDLTDRVVVGGGGGGNGWNCSTDNHGGNGGGGGTAENGRECNNINSSSAGRGATQTAGGQNAPSCTNALPFAGSFGQGGQGNCSNQSNGGGGGGGWFGGGGGLNGGGGGGSSYADPALTSAVIHDQGFRNGNGEIRIRYRFCEGTVSVVPLTVTPINFLSVLNDTVSCGGAAQLTAIGNGNNVSWFTSQNSTTPVFQGQAASFFVQNQPTTYWVEASNTGFRTDSVSFNFTGNTQTWTVPAGVTSIFVDALGAQGGSNSHSSGGLGGRVRSTISVTPGELLRINVGGTTTNNNGGWNGGGLSGSSFSTSSARGGGGSTDIRSGGTSTSNRILVAGAGGGAGANCNGLNNERGGNGGGPATAQDGVSCNSIGNSESGRGGTQSGGGINATSCTTTSIHSGSAGQGGQGNCSNQSNGGGGGSGWFGGGGGRNGGGGGGSSYVDPTRGSGITHNQGVNSGNGSITIYFQEPITCTSQRVPVVAHIDSLPAPTVSADAIGCAPVTNTFSVSGGLQPYNWYTAASGDVPVGTGNTFTETSSDTITFFVGYTDPNGCPSKRAASSILPTPIPNAGIAVGSTVFCENDGVVTLQATTPGGVWSGTGIVDANLGTLNVSLLAPGTATVDYAVTANGCTNSATSSVQILAAPNATITSSPVSICINAAPVALNTQTGNGVWSGNGVNMNGVADPAVLGTGNFMAFYSIADVNGCSDTDSLAVIINALPNASIVNPSPVVCTSSLPVNLSAATPGGTWSGTGVNASTGQFSPSQSGQGTFSIDYSVTANGCTSIESTSIQVQSGPNPAITTAPSALCANSNPVQLQTVAAGGTWSGSGISSPSVGIFNPSLAGTGTQMIYYSIVQGPCTAVDSVAFVVNPAPVAAVSPGSAQTICDGSTVAFTATGGTSYQWSLNGQIIAGATSASLNATLPGVYNVVATDNNTCSATSNSVNLNVNAKPVINAIQVPAVCQGQNSQFSSNVSVSPNGGAIVSGYAWDFGAAGTSLAFQPSVQFTGAGSFPVTLIVTTNQNCSDTLTTNAVVNPNPVLSNVTATNACAGGLTQFSANATVAPVNNAQIVNQNWNFGGQTISGQIATQQFNSPGFYGYSFTAVTNHGCSSTVNNSVQVYAAPVALFTASDGCEGSTIPFGDLSSNNVTNWSWNFGDGNTANVASPAHTYQTSGTFIPNLTVTTAEGCSASFSMSVQVAPTPQASFNETPIGGLAYQFSPSVPMPGANYVWTFGDGTASTDVAPLKTYLTPGIYTVCLSVSRGNCTSSACEQVNITEVAGTENAELAAAMVYPNPYTEYFQIDFVLSVSEEVSVQLYDLSGKLLMSREEGSLGAGSHSIVVADVASNLPAGTYLLKLNAGNQSRMFRLVHLSH
jgi:PKD repeat protein